MKIWPIAAFAFFSLIFSGCRTDPNIALLERDNRRLEDEIYRLRGMVADYETTDCATTETTTTRPNHRTTRDDRDTVTKPAHDIPPGATTTPPSVEMEESPENEIPGIPPRSNRPPTRANKPSAPGAFKPPHDSRAMPGAESAGPALGAADEVTPPVPAAEMSYSPPVKGDSFNVVQIVLHDRLCRATEDGLRVVFETRDRNGRRVDAAGDVNIVLIDPTMVPPQSKITPPEARVARFDLPAEAVASMFRGMGTSKVIDIQMPWRGQMPEQKNLRLFVRYTTRDGRKLVAGDLPIQITNAAEQNADRTTRAEPSGRFLIPTPEENSGPTLAQDEPPPSRSTAEDAPPPERREPIRTANRDSGTHLKRPEWSPERR